MKLQTVIKFSIGFFLIYAVTYIITYKTCPILIKYWEGTARNLGKPINAKVYTNGKINHDIKIYHPVEKWEFAINSDDYIVSLKEYDIDGMLKYFNINLNEKWLGRPVGTSSDAYDTVFGYLFQSEVGGHFTPFPDDMKGYSFDPELSFTAKQILFKVPPKLLKYDSVRIELP